MPQIGDSVNPYSVYSDGLSALCDKHAPATEIVVTELPDTPWYTSDVRHVKTECRRWERKWKRTKLAIDFEIYRSHQQRLKTARDKAKADYIKNKLDCATTPKETYNILNHLLHKKNTTPLPQHDSEDALATVFADFFVEKINKVREHFPSTSSSLLGTDAQQPPSPSTVLTEFQMLSDEQVASLVASSPTKSCLLDPLPTWLLKQCPAAVQAIRCVINSYLQSGTVPPSQKTALVKPLLKKSSLNPNELKNYRPVSNKGINPADGWCMVITRSRAMRFTHETKSSG